jgi:hypothetical protein
MPKRKTPELKPEEQFKRFQEAAEKLGVDESKAARAFSKFSNRPVKTQEKSK